MAVKELTVGEKLKDLYVLQSIDSEIDQIEVLKGELPIEVRDLEDEIVGLETRINRLQNNVNEVQSELSRHEANIQEANGLIEKYNKQMDNVKNNREYDALTKEIEMQKLEIQLSEKKTREAKVSLENKQGTLDVATERFNQRNGDLEIKKVELEKIIEKTVKEEEKLRKKSEKHRKVIEDRLLLSYDKVRGAYRNGLAVVTVKRNACGGCFNKIPPQLQLEISLSKKIIACEHCGRVLVDDNIMTVGEETEAEA